MASKLAFPKKTKKNKRVPQAPQDADEFLAAGVELEEAGEKWRAGDAAKSARFFSRALENYSQGLERYPQSFDLAYNRARVQYSVTQYPLLLEQFPGGTEVLLRTALDYHKLALSLDLENADVLFNTAQVYSSLSNVVPGQFEQTSEACSLLYSALDLFQRCLAIQEATFAQQKEEQLANETAFALANEDGGVPLTTSNISTDQIRDDDEDVDDETVDGEDDGQWALAIQPVYIQTMLETVEQILDTFADLCDYVAESNAHYLEHIKVQCEFYETQKIPAYSKEDADADISDCVAAILRCKACIYEAAFGISHDVQNYDRQLKTLFDSAEVSTDSAARSSSNLSVLAQAWIAFANAVMESQVESSETAASLSTCWNRLNTALDVLGQAAKKAAGDDGISRIHLGRGDAEMLRFSLTQRQDLAATLRTPQVQATLLKNAGTYYKGAARTAEASKTARHDGTLKEAEIKLAVVECLVSGGQTVEPLVRLQVSGEEVLEVISDTVSITKLPQSLQTLLKAQ